MANYTYTYGGNLIINGMDFDAVTLKALLVMTNTTADTEKDKTTISGFTTLDEMDGTGYSRQTLTVTNTVDTTNHWTRVSATITFPNVSAGTRQVQGVVVYEFVTNDADSVPVFWFDTVTGITFPFDTPAGSG